ncbi:unnamed protein product [Diatraea saccharalis]|uniref:Uncharacterized protein n=1 Tax=Diatraea saccharalis TaxID=40085 RepID=A0A9N9R8B4_9NEOP|nr:unnamed protein product [Diatraea saccharalis]
MSRASSDIGFLIGADSTAGRAHARRTPSCARASTPRDRDRPRGTRAMPAVKVFNIFGAQKPTDKQPDSQSSPMQKFYRTFSVPSQTSNEKNTKVTAIAACLEKRLSEPIPNNDNVQKFSKNNNSVSIVNDKRDDSKHVYENVNIVSAKNSAQRDILLDETKGYSSIYENIVIVGKPDTKEVLVETKLNKALQSFDKILTEFSESASLTHDFTCTNNGFKVPKLQKSKTCSIIESRCILKKTNSDPENDSKTRNKVVRNNSIDKTTSLWNLDDMKSKELTSPLMPLAPITADKMNPDKYATYKISSKNPSRLNCIKNEDLKKLDVKTRILKKTLSNPPSTPVPVISKTKPLTKKVDKKTTDPKKAKPKTCTVNGSSDVKMILESKEAPKSQLQKAKSVWEIGNEIIISPNLERTRSTTSIAGSPSKIPVIRSQMMHSKFSSTRALFSPTPVDLNIVDQARECAQKKMPISPRKPMEKLDANKQIRQKSQLCLKTEIKRQLDKTKKDAPDNKKTFTSPKPSLRDYSEEINAVRAKIQQRKINKRDIVIVSSDSRRNENDAEEIDSTLTPVKSIVKKIELKTALETKADAPRFLSCKVIPPVHKELCVANTTFHNHLSTLVGRQVKYVESKNDSETCSQVKKLELHKHNDEKIISDTNSDCSDDSGHVSNDAANDNDSTFDNVHDLSPPHTSIDEVDCKFDNPKKFGVTLSENVKAVCPVRPARRNARNNEVVSGTRTTDAPKVDEQVCDTVNI